MSMPRRFAAMSLLASLGLHAHAAETTVQNDSVNDGTTATICPCFIAGEEVAAWLTSPCNGNIVAIQIFWRSLTAGATDSLESNIFIYDGDTGVFPTPGPVLETLGGPVMVDGVLNEFRFLDENQTIPINVPVTAGQEFVISLEFFNPSPAIGPSVVFDGDGIQAGKNAVFAIPGGWLDASLLGVSGDWFIRAIVDCDEVTSGACCLLAGPCVDDVEPAACAAAPGIFLGAASSCAGDPCADLPGACCFGGGGCLELTAANCAVAFGMFQGIGTSCPDDCVSPCPGDIDGDGDTDTLDFGIFAPNFGTSGHPPFTNGDLDGDGDVDSLDFAVFAPDFGCGT